VFNLLTTDQQSDDFKKPVRFEFFKQLASLIDEPSKFRQEFFENEQLVHVFFSHIFVMIESLTQELEA
jgi:hypothetical protein